MTAEQERLREARERGTPWRKWGPYLRDRWRQSAREHQDANSATPSCASFESTGPHGADRDCLAGICDERMRLCFAVGLWNGCDASMTDVRVADPPHGCASLQRSIYLDNVPTHSYMRVLYKYPPCFDVFVEYAKAAPEQILIRITVDNRGLEPASLHVLPQLWFGQTQNQDPRVPAATLHRQGGPVDSELIVASHPYMGVYYLGCKLPSQIVFTGNEPRRPGDAASSTKATAHYVLRPPSQESRCIRLTLNDTAPSTCAMSVARFDAILQDRRSEAAEFYAALSRKERDVTFSRTFRRAFTTALWNKEACLHEIGGRLHAPSSKVSAQPCQYMPFLLTTSVVVSTPSRCQQRRFMPWWPILHALALARIDSELAFDQLNMLLGGGRSQRPCNTAASAPSRNTALNAWATLLMYRLQRPEHPDRAFIFLRRAFNLLFAQQANTAWTGLYAQSMFEMAIELALTDRHYEHTAIECYLRLLSAIARMEPPGKRDDSFRRGTNDVARPRHSLVDTHDQSCIRSPLGLLAVCAAAIFREPALRRLSQLVEFVYEVTRENGAYGMFKPLKAALPTGRRAAGMIDERVIRALLTNLFVSVVEPLPARALATLPRTVVLLRALLSLSDCLGDGFRVEFSGRGQPAMSLFEIAVEIYRHTLSSLHQNLDAGETAASGPRAREEVHWRNLIQFYERVYCDGCGRDRSTGWAGRIAPLLCVASDYQAFECDALESHRGLAIASCGPGLRDGEGAMFGPLRRDDRSKHEAVARGSPQLP